MGEFCVLLLYQTNCQKKNRRESLSEDSQAFQLNCVGRNLAIAFDFRERAMLLLVKFFFGSPDKWYAFFVICSSLLLVRCISWVGVA